MMEESVLKRNGSILKGNGCVWKGIRSLLNGDGSFKNVMEVV